MSVRAVRLRRVASPELSPEDLRAVRRLLDEAFGGRFTQDDWHHTLGGLHVLALEEGELVAHAAVVDRTLRAAGHPLRTGYVEGVATRPDRRRQGLAAGQAEPGPPGVRFPAGRTVHHRRPIPRHPGRA